LHPAPAAAPAHQEIAAGDSHSVVAARPEKTALPENGGHSQASSDAKDPHRPARVDQPAPTPPTTVVYDETPPVPWTPATDTDSSYPTGTDPSTVTTPKRTHYTMDDLLNDPNGWGQDSFSGSL